MSSRVELRVKVNGTEHVKDVEPRRLLVDFLREDLGLTGTHIGCDTSNCGCCTILMDGASVKSCTVLAVQAHGRSITTIEGLAGGDHLGVIQQSFTDKHGLQCGYCTPGMVMEAAYFLSKNPSPTREEIREGISGNLCRCTGYTFIVDAIEEAASRLSKAPR